MAHGHFTEAQKCLDYKKEKKKKNLRMKSSKQYIFLKKIFLEHSKEWNISTYVFRSDNE